jgi:hypothetical protein
VTMNVEPAASEMRSITARRVDLRGRFTSLFARGRGRMARFTPTNDTATLTLTTLVTW